MALSASSVLHYWTARYGSVPVVGGKPTHSRNSAAKWVDQQGVPQSSVVNTPRFEWATIDSERRQVLRLERARVNLATDFSSWGLTNCTRSSATDPAGGNGAYLLTATAGNGSAATNISGIVSNGTKTLAVALRKGSAALTDFGLFDSTASAWRHRVVAQWNADGTLTLFDQAGAGANYPVVQLADGYYAVFLDAASVVATNTNQLILYPAGTSGGTGSVYAYLPYAGNLAGPSSLLDPGATMASDAFKWDFNRPPMAMMVYARFIERGTLINTTLGERLFQFGDDAGSNPRFLVYNLAGAYTVYHNNGTAVSTASLPGGATIGSMVEIVALLVADGSTGIRQSIGGAAVTTASDGTPAALQSTWGVAGRSLWLNSSHSGVSVGVNDFAELKVVKYADVAAVTAQGQMDELRAFELGPNGVVL